MGRLKGLYGLKEMSINVPDEDVKAFHKVIDVAVKKGALPDTAKDWSGMRGAAAAPLSGPSPSAQATSEPAQKGKGKKSKEKEPAAPQRQPIPVSPETQAILGKSSSAWDKLANAGVAKPEAEPQNFTPAQKPEPKKQGMFDPTDREIDFDPRSTAGSIPGWDDTLGAPPSANVPAAKKKGALSRIFGQKPKKSDDTGMAAQPKPGVLSRVFGKGGPKIKGQQGDTGQFRVPEPQKAPDLDLEPDKTNMAANAARRGHDFVSQGDVEPDTGPQSFVEPDDWQGDLRALGQSPSPRPGTGEVGTDVVNNLNWQMHGRGKAAGPAPAPAQKKKDIGPSVRSKAAQHKPQPLAKRSTTK